MSQTTGSDENNEAGSDATPLPVELTVDVHDAQTDGSQPPNRCQYGADICRVC